MRPQLSTSALVSVLLVALGLSAVGRRQAAPAHPPQGSPAVFVTPPVGIAPWKSSEPIRLHQALTDALVELDARGMSLQFVETYVDDLRQEPGQARLLLFCRAR